MLKLGFITLTGLLGLSHCGHTVAPQPIDPEPLKYEPLNPTPLNNAPLNTTPSNSEPLDPKSETTTRTHRPQLTIQADWDHKPDGSSWTAITVQALQENGAALLNSAPNDIAQFCPNYENLTRENQVAFWTLLISSLARFESNHDPATSYVEKFRDRQGNFIVSRGLLQLSIESGRGYNCNIPDAQSLHDPEVNLTCGVTIMNRWVGQRDGMITGKSGGKWRGAARYWSPFRNAQKTTAIAERTRKLKACQN